MLAILAPQAPPCFGHRDVWVSYCASASVAQRNPVKQPGPLRAAPIIDIVDISLIPDKGVPSVVQDGLLYTFNAKFDFCGDCELSHRMKMHSAGRCNPKALKEKP
jgi:hypothetical protein